MGRKASTAAGGGPNKRQRLESSGQPLDAVVDERIVSHNHPALPLHSPRSAWIEHTLLWEEPHNDMSGEMRDDDDDIDTATALQTLREELNGVKRHMGAYAKQDSLFRSIRRVCDPYALLSDKRGLNRGALFMNRSAMKLANMDYLTGFALSTPIAGEDTRMDDTDDDRNPSLLTFVDLCGAPGGFGEYLVWRTDGQTRGFGMSLVGNNDQGRGLPWKRGVQHESRSLCYRVCNGSDGTGDVCNWDNIQWLEREINGSDWGEGSESGGVDLVVADGGTDAQRNSEYQEQISLKLFVCQVAAGLHLLRPGGSLVVKAFGFATETSRTVLLDLAQHFFDRLTLVKPITSRPASAERYLIAQGFRGRGINWDGRRWISRMFLGETALENTEHLTRSIDDFEGEILTLNLDACRAILDALEDHDGNRLDSANQHHEEPIHLFAYRRAWELP